MPVGAIIGGVASIGGALIGSSAQKKAANKAADVSLQTAQENNRLAQNIYNQNAAALTPFQQRGNAAGNAINALLGLGVPQQQPSNAPQMNPMMRFGTPYGYMGGSGIGDGMIERQMFESMGGDMYYPQGYREDLPQVGANANGQYQAMTSPQADYNNAFNNYRNSTGYQFRFNEGMRAIDAAAPVLNSGARMKALQNYGQNIASGEFGNYLGQLANQQGVGLSGASAQAGVGQNYVNTVSANNNSAGTAAANAALMRGQATSNMWGGIASGLGGLFGSSFGR
jgi:hypothetical protein